MQRNPEIIPKIQGKPWKNKDQNTCSFCHVQLTTFKRHHCRLCGCEFCTQHIRHRTILAFLPYITCVYEEHGVIIPHTRLSRDSYQQFYICDLCENFRKQSSGFQIKQRTQSVAQEEQNRQFSTSFDTRFATNLIFDLIRFTAVELKKAKQLPANETDTSKVSAYARGQMAATIAPLEIEPLLNAEWIKIYNLFIEHVQTMLNPESSFPYIIRLKPFFLHDKTSILAKNFFLDALQYELSSSILEYSGSSDGIAGRSIPVSLHEHLRLQITPPLIRSFFADTPTFE